MKLVLSHTSALDLIRTLRWRGKKLQPAYVRTLDDCACSLGDIHKIVVPAFDQSTERLEVLANTNAHQQNPFERPLCRDGAMLDCGDFPDGRDVRVRIALFPWLADQCYR